MRRYEGGFGGVLDKPAIAVLSTGGAAQALSIVVPKDLPASFCDSLEQMKRRRLISIKGVDEPDVQLEDGRKVELQLQLEDDHVVFNILDQVVSDYGLKRIYHGLANTSPPDRIVSVLSSACHFYWHLRRNHKHPIAEDVQVEFLEITYSSDEVDDSGGRILVATENDMLRDGTIELLVHKEPTMYGIKLTNHSKWDLFPIAIYFDNSDWGIGASVSRFAFYVLAESVWGTETYYHPGTAGPYKHEAPLRTGGTLTIGYGCGGGDPISFRLRPNQDVDVGHLKIFLSTKPAELRNVEQGSPFTTSQTSQRAGRQRPAVFDTWLSLQYPIVQRRDRAV
jgi:hypothetical protein